MSAWFALIALALVFSTPALADCVEPRAPSALPDGKSASKGDMLTTKKQVDQFKRDAEAYFECSKDNRRVEVLQQDLEKLAKRFNDEVRAFKAANPAS
ncbi:MAG: hypothetical protein ABW136_10895 [Steroidobacteraceae bacterium]